MPGIARKTNNSIDDCSDSNTNYLSTLVGNGTLRYHSFNGSSVSSNGFWSKHRDDISYSQLQKFWCELTPQARQKLLRIDKQTLFEHARKNMYCSRCNGLLLEGYLQIVLYGKSLQQDTAAGHYIGGSINSQNDGVSLANECQGDVMDPSVHPWGGLTTARDGTLTLLDCYLCSKSLKGLQNVFDSARARERERKLLYPDACGGGGRGWISQGIVGYGRGHGARETCALHTARLSVETLVDFWSALGEETRQSLLRMKEEDFIERLMYRFDSKRFCRDCRRNVIREFKELKELKRMRREPCCTSWFCVADTAFQYEVSCDTVHADWHQTFSDTFGAYHHFEWAIGSGEGKSDILEFENVGLTGSVQVNGLDLSSLNACYITLRAWKMDGRCNELCVKAHALRGQQCVHCRLAVGDGHVTITRGDSIRRFFEHAEEAEEEEDDDSMDKDGNELDGECSRPQKHAKSPELAREFLLDAATVIFKEQVEKAFREGTARQNAHSIFVCLALKLLEERVHVACKEIITLEKQVKLLEEEEKEKREEEERKERRRTKERGKKLRRKERLREKESKEKKCAESAVVDPMVPEVTQEEGANLERSRDSVSETGEEATPASPLSSDIQDDQLLMEVDPNTENLFEVSQNEECHNTRGWNTSSPYNHYKYSRRKTKFWKDPQQDLALKWCNRRKIASFSENGVGKYESSFHADGFESTRSSNGCFNKQLRTKFVSRLDSPISDTPKTYYRGKSAQAIVDVRPKSKTFTGNPFNTKKVWEPLDSQKKFAQSNSASSNDALKPTPKPEASGSDDVIDISVQNCTEEKDVTDLKKLSDENHARVDSSICSSSNSDNCSCLSEGDSNTSSNPQNNESASTSDSEVCSHNSEGKETSHCSETKGQASNKNLEPKAATESCEEVRDHVGISAPPPQSVKLPQMQNQSLHYPVFQGPAMGYYHQSPVSWHSGPSPSNGLMSFPHSNHYLYATNSFGYELNGNAPFMQYGAVKHLPPPLLNPAHAPTLTTVNGVSTNENAKVVNMQKAASVGQNSGETRKVANGGPNGISDKTDKWTNGFSLFHFGGPVALSTRLKEGSVGDSVNLSDNKFNDGSVPLCNKKDSIEEYNLFAASNGIKFSIS